MSNVQLKSQSAHFRTTYLFTNEISICLFVYFSDRDPDAIDGQIMEAVREVFEAKRDVLRKALEDYKRPK